MLSSTLLLALLEVSLVVQDEMRMKELGGEREDDDDEAPALARTGRPTNVA